MNQKIENTSGNVPNVQALAPAVAETALQNSEQNPVATDGCQQRSCSPEVAGWKAVIVSESGRVIWGVSMPEKRYIPPRIAAIQFAVSVATKMQEIGYTNESLYFFCSESPNSVDIESVWSSIVGLPDARDTNVLEEYTVNPSDFKNLVKDSTSDSDTRKEAIVAWLNSMSCASLEWAMIYKGGSVGANVSSSPALVAENESTLGADIPPLPASGAAHCSARGGPSVNSPMWFLERWRADEDLSRESKPVLKYIGENTSWADRDIQFKFTLDGQEILVTKAYLKALHYCIGVSLGDDQFVDPRKNPVN